MTEKEKSTTQESTEAPIDSNKTSDGVEEEEEFLAID